MKTAPRSRSRRRTLRPILGIIAIALMLLPSTSSAKLPEPKPDQARAAAEKKAKASAQAEKDKQALAQKMEEIAQRWRQRAAENNWKTHPATATENGAAARPDREAKPAGDTPKPTPAPHGERGSATAGEAGAGPARPAQ